MKRLILIDGNAILHRAYHALPPLTNRQGELINAVYGFCTMLLKIIDDYSPEYLIVAFDTGKPTFRHDEYIGYQVHRPALDTGLAGQFEKVYALLRAFEIPIFQAEGYEADDVIGTVALQATHADEHGFKKLTETDLVDEVIIVTGDRDILQLVNKNIKVLMPKKGLSDTQLLGEAEVEEKMEIKPSQIIDFKALSGDQSDNYPGVLGIGSKTAVNLLKEFGTLETIYKHLDSLPPAVRKKLEEGQDSSQMSKRLATIETRVPLDFVLEESRFVWDEEKKKIVAVRLKNLGFPSLAVRLNKTALDEKPKQKKKKETKEGQMTMI